MQRVDEQSKQADAVVMLGTAEARELTRSVPLWTLSEKWIERDFTFGSFRQAMVFANQVADVAEKQGHHPDIFISYDRVHLTLSTHKVGGLSRKDFLLATTIDDLPGDRVATVMER